MVVENDRNAGTTSLRGAGRERDEFRSNEDKPVDQIQTPRVRIKCADRQLNPVLTLRPPLFQPIYMPSSFRPPPNRASVFPSSGPLAKAVVSEKGG